ncbi:glutamate 5-kinase [Acidothermus cellulolyticus 11B]|uniref:Glutamate 5-kinase n=1 Tax=Acidothermus cellulolyticus (strain ATCC 43068 / DSM 8971 / 11B) TaxID=351607 RepID=A0LSX2_ACIC1|nr:glutamate 5-kinase [Acidothermus cellulolyticus]ABK52532.1 glutamate 5-kinase [Acidothermus cellulolyticus 11B]
MSGTRPEVTAAQTIVVKIGSSSVTSYPAARAGSAAADDQPGGSASGLREENIAALAAAVAERVSRGAHCVIVSSGAIAAGLGPLGLVSRPRDLATQQAAASVGQSLLVRAYARAFAVHRITVGQILLTSDDMIRRAHYRNAERTLRRLFELGVVPIVNENDTVVTDEIRFGDNDRLAALVAHLIRADLLVLLSDVDALYTAPPNRPGARRIEVVSSERDLDAIDLGGVGTAVGTGGMITKIEAARLATSAGIPVVLTAATAVAAALRGDDVGTFFRPTGRRMSSRLLWLAHATAPRGRLVLDAGAVAAVVDRRLSLLPAGVVGVHGDFNAGDPVDLVDEHGRRVARGLVNYDAADLPNLIGRSTWELAQQFGPDYQREVVHRDDLVVLVRRSR